MRWSRTNRVRAGALAMLVAALFLVTSSVAPVAVEARAVAAALVRPNIVLILTDDQTMEAVARMPYVSSRTDWISFDRAFINNGLCCPSRATILTGRYDTHTRVGTNVDGDLLDERQTLAVWLRRAGYQTGLFGKYLNGYPFGRGLYVPSGWSNWQAAYNSGTWGIYSQYHWKLNSNGVSSSHGDAPADYMPTVLGGRLRTFIRNKAAAHQPFFALYAPTATHRPWTASPTRKGTYATAPVSRSPSFNVVAPDQPAYLRAQPLLDGAGMDADRRMEWDAALSVDDEIARIDTALRNAKVYDNTIVIFMTDNGYSFGNHRWERKRCEFTECMATPMLVRYPGLPARHDASHLISNVDMAATVLELAGAPAPPIPQDGMSFAPLVLGRTVTWRDAILMHWPGGDMEGDPGQPDSMPQFWAVLAWTTDGGLWKYVELDTGERELYDEIVDPFELDNRAGDPGVADVQTDLANRLAALKATAGFSPTAPLRTDLPVAGTSGPDLG